jgi:hypothetical protein
MIYPINNIQKLEITNKEVIVTYTDETKMTIPIPDYHHNYKDTLGNFHSQHHNTLIFELDYHNPNDSPEIDHCI